MHAIMGMGLLGLVGKIHKWDESAMFFDGSSLGASPLSSLLDVSFIMTINTNYPPPSI